ncbi:uncharacterized protein LOC130413483 isoform X2 [Triplophysa dalaica]|uniref:uncharacterized protein LOC130413483 isoform X2 n=1 Tax=Triplophysa dalaica TaxID=1582913 RepID=UPI0024E0086B|nr:uncharacterized protein LOC130413483 isoform X2 [Triplophysa dalaica]
MTVATLLLVFLLTDLLGDTKLHVSSQNVTAYEGENINIQCYGASKWCKIGGSCAEEKVGTLDKNKVDISGDDKVLRVTLKALQREDAGWYFCSDGQSQIPVYISLGIRPHLNNKSVLPFHLKTPSDRKQYLWLVILGPVVSIIICGSVILLNLKKRKQRADASEIYECMDGRQIPQERNHEKNAHENVYEDMSRTKSNIKQTVKDDTYANVVKQSRSSDSP